MRLRKPAICSHGIAECRFLNSAGSCFAASLNYLEIAHHCLDRLFVSEKCERIKRPRIFVASVNRADGISEIEGKAARVAASDLGNERVSNPWFALF